MLTLQNVALDELVLLRAVSKALLELLSHRRVDGLLALRGRPCSGGWHWRFGARYDIRQPSTGQLVSTGDGE